METKQGVIFLNYRRDEAKEAEPLDASFHVSSDAERAIIFTANCNDLALKKLSLVMSFLYIIIQDKGMQIEEGEIFLGGRWRSIKGERFWQKRSKASAL